MTPWRPDRNPHPRSGRGVTRHAVSACTRRGRFADASDATRARVRAPVPPPRCRETPSACRDLAAGSDTSRNCSCCEKSREPRNKCSLGESEISHCAAAGQRSAERQLVGELQIAAHRQARRDTRHGQSGDVTQHPHQIRRGRLALGVRIRRDDHLGDVHAVDPFANPVEQLANSQLLGSHPGQRIQCATETW